MVHKKLRTLSANYDNLGEPAVQRELRVCTENLQVYAEVRCLTLNEMWKKRAEKVREWYEQRMRDPNTQSLDSAEKSMGLWVSDQRKSKKRGELSDERIAILEAIPGWAWKGWDYDRTVKEFCALRARLGYNPSILSPNPIERRFGYWLSSQRESKRRGDILKERIAILEAIPGWTWKAHNYDESANRFRAFREGLGCDPRYTSSDPVEQKMARWMSTQRKLKKRGELPDERIAILEAIPCWRWEAPIGPRPKSVSVL